MWPFQGSAQTRASRQNRRSDAARYTVKAGSASFTVGSSRPQSSAWFSSVARLFFVKAPIWCPSVAFQIFGPRHAGAKCGAFAFPGARALWPGLLLQVLSP